MDEKTSQAAQRDIRNALKALRKATGLTQKAFGEKVKLHDTQVSKFETGERIPPRDELERILEASYELTGIKIQDFLAKLGLSEEEYDWIQDWKVAQPDIASQLHDARTADDVNQWLAGYVLNRGRGRPPSLGDLDKLYSSITQTFASARYTAITYPAHPLTRNNQIVQARDGILPSISLPSLQSLRQGYFGEGPRITWMDGLSQKTLLVEILSELAKPIVKSGGEKGALAKVILENYELMESAFKDQMMLGKWQYLDIILKSAVVKLVETGELPRDLSLKYLGVNKLTDTQVWDLLIEVVDRLESSETYRIALLDDINYPADGEVQLLKQFITQHFWTAKPGRMGNST